MWKGAHVISARINRRRFAIGAGVFFALAIALGVADAFWPHHGAGVQATVMHHLLDTGAEVSLVFAAVLMLVGILGRVLAPVETAFRLGYEAGHQDALAHQHAQPRAADVIPLVSLRRQRAN